MFPNILLLIYFCPGLISIANGDCFWIDGTVAKGHTPCYDLNTVGASMCCAQDAPEFISCTPGGICQYKNGRDDDGRSFWRDSCSDRTWLDSACLAIAPYVMSSDVRSNRCEDGSFCPRTESDLNMTCCNNHQGQKATNFGATLPASSTTSAESPEGARSTPTLTSASLPSTFISLSGLKPSTTSADASSSSSASSPTIRPSSNRGDGFSKAEKIANILGCVVAFISLVVALVIGINGWKQCTWPRQPQSG